MKKIIYSLAVISVLAGCKTASTVKTPESNTVMVSMDLVNVVNDQVKVTVNPGKFTTSTTTFHIPKTVPGTYSIDNYGELIVDLKAIDYEGNTIPVTKSDENSWSIPNAINVDKVEYLVNDSFDIDGEKGIFSPSGTNIEKGKNFMLNLHGFVGYFDDLQEVPFELDITRPKELIAGTSLDIFSSTASAENANTVKDVFKTNRYFEVTDHPIMYAPSDTTHIQVQGMDVILDVYSPNKVYTSKSIAEGITKMVTAQKSFLGDLDNTKKYAILLYLSDPKEMSAKGFGALEHHTSTAVVLPESMPLEALKKSMTDVVSHEFFHIITPLGVHSNEIHYFDYNDPKMSQHLWMYEGVTEYFANLFQVNQGLIDNNAFYDRMSEKIQGSKNFNDSIPFTEISRNILSDDYKDEYYNVYQKGALIGMALDIRLRELSNGQSGILDLMKKLTAKYGKDKPFEDDELIPAIVDLTYPEIKTFFDTYVTGNTPIPYEEFLNKVGVQYEQETVNTSVFINGQIPYIDGNPQNNELFIRNGLKMNSFLEELGAKNGDVIKSINGTEYNIQTAYNLVSTSMSWKEGDDITFIIERDGKEMTLKSKYSQPTDTKIVLREMDLPATDKKVELRNAWLKK